MFYNYFSLFSAIICFEKFTNSIRDVRDIRRISGGFAIRTAGFGGWPPYNVSEPKTVGPDGGYPATQTLSRWQISAGYPVIKDLGLISRGFWVLLSHISE